MASIHGNINHAMRQNYDEFGVDNYYQKVASTYRNPFFPGIRKVIFAFMNRWWEAEGCQMYDQGIGRSLQVLDLAAGSGEATICVLDWEAATRGTTSSSQVEEVASAISSISSSSGARAPFIPPNAGRVGRAPSKPLIGSKMPRLSADIPPISVSAMDPYTAPAYTARTSRPCHPLSFADLASGLLPPDLPELDNTGLVWDLIICSFALHLVPESEMFPICYELSSKSKWLVVIAPHKKPEIKEGWGWERWDLSSWQPAGESLYRNSAEDGDSTETELEIVREKVRLRLYRSVNI